MAQSGRIYDSFHEYDREGFAASDRFYVRSTVYLPSSEVDPRTGMLRDDARRHGRTQALRMEAENLEQEYAKLDATIQKRQKEKGIRVSLRGSVLLITFIILCFAVILLVQQGTLIQRQRSLKTINQRIEETKAANDDLKAQIADASDATNICYAAARDLGMVPADSAQAVHLTAVDTRPSGPTQNVNVMADAQTTQNSYVAPQDGQ